jgi:D-proline reductase (dithiol) PrdB
VSLVARQLEAGGIATVILGSAKDIVEYCGVPRFLFTDFPLGNPCGKPYDAEMQRDILRRGIALLADATGPRATVQTPYAWGTDPSWREKYMEVTPENSEQLRREGELRRRGQQAGKKAKRATQ